MTSFRLAVLCGGPSLERGISLNSARSVADHLAGAGIEIVPIYFDQRRHPYLLSPGQLYSNTPSDFDFRIDEVGKPLSQQQLSGALKKVDLVFSAMHGPFGEDGELQALLEELEIPFVGSPSRACKRCFDKFFAHEALEEWGFHNLPCAVLKIHRNDHEQIVREFFREHRLERAVVKPASGGSSIGVFSVSTPEEALERAALLFSKRMDTRVVVEAFARGTEFTVIILQNRFGLPTALIPTEIEADYERHQIFDFRRKYLPTRQVTFHCPPRFPDVVIERIRVQAEQLFAMFGMADCARFDGWVLEDGRIWFSDFNPVSGMEQNSFLFQQAARVGLSHAETLLYIIRSACRRLKLAAPFAEHPDQNGKQPVAVLFGGRTSERQVSLMSGTNVWLKLRGSSRYLPVPHLMDAEGGVWKVPYALLLNHTVEEIVDACRRAEVDEARLRQFEQSARLRLAVDGASRLEDYFVPQKMTLAEFASRNRLVFNALHGGEGENGQIQRLFEEGRVLFNGSGSQASALCMDKYETARQLEGLQAEGVLTIPRRLLITDELLRMAFSRLTELWNDAVRELGSKSLIVKPREDGCSSGIVRLMSNADLRAYLEYIRSGAARIPGGVFEGQSDPIEMPTARPQTLLLEKFIDTDRVRAVGTELRVSEHSGWIEVTIGVLENEKGLYALNPSLTVVEGEVLSVEEKFQGGTGINITPPPEEILSKRCCSRVQRRIELVARRLGIGGYARIDAFVERATGRVMVIEANTLPGLTPSTVLFHQGIAEKPALLPLALLERILTAAQSQAGREELAASAANA
jgi:D-alanine--D-alanine ligase